MRMSCLDFKEFQLLYAYKIYAYKKKGVLETKEIRSRLGMRPLCSKYIFQYS